jgi:membrane-associated protease RseP (regulator of RpoE activity)
MSFFVTPPHSRYDLNFSLGGIPVRVHPFFWLAAILLGFRSGSIVVLLIWVAAFFVSILVHELGHALMMRVFGQDSRILLYMFGGLAIPESSYRGRGWPAVTSESNRQIIILLAGPFAGFLLAALIVGLVAVLGGVVSLTTLFGIFPLPVAGFPDGGIINVIIGAFLWVNVFWGFINLMPVYPLDGGQIARILFLKADPWDGLRKSLWLSLVAGIILAAAGFLLFRSSFMAILFLILALQSYATLQGNSSLY